MNDSMDDAKERARVADGTLGDLADMVDALAEHVAALSPADRAAVVGPFARRVRVLRASLNRLSRVIDAGATDH